MKYENAELRPKIFIQSAMAGYRGKGRLESLSIAIIEDLEIQLETGEGHLVNHSRNTYCDYMLDTVLGA